MPTDGGHLLLSRDDRIKLEESAPRSAFYIRRFVGAQELINGLSRYCLWIEDEHLPEATKISEIADRIDGVKKMRSESSAPSTREWAKFGHKFRQIQGICASNVIIVPRVTSENRAVLPVDFQDEQSIVGDRNFAICDAPIWNLALIASRLHWVWVGALSARLEMRLSYANTLCWNTFPLPKLTEQNKLDLTRCAEEILLTREHYFPATIADMYDPDRMDADFPLVRAAHERNDEVLERIYIGRRFKNDTERLEKLFDLYTKMTASDVGNVQKARKKAVRG
jgi:hypothetical protein